MRNFNQTRMALLLIYLLAVFYGTYQLVDHYHQLAFHIDFSFYMEFIAKTFNPELDNVYSFNGSGHNFFGMVTHEGTLGFHHTAHFELIKYPLALIYRLIPSIYLTLFIFSLLYFLPILSLALFAKGSSKLESAILIVVALLFFVYPPSLPALLNDLRPRMLFNAAIPLVIFAIHFNRPSWQVLLAFAFLLIVREEAVIFAIPLMLFALFQPIERQTLKKNVVGMLFLLAVYLLGILWFYTSADYLYDPRWNSFAVLFEHDRAFGLLALASIAALALILRAYVLLNHENTIFPKWLSAFARVRDTDERITISVITRLVSLSLLLFPLVGQFYLLLMEKWVQSGLASRSERLADTLDRLLYSEHLAILGLVTISILLIAWLILPNKVVRYVIPVILALILAFSVPTFFTDHASLPGLAPVELPAQDVFALKRFVDPHEAIILTDYTTLLAFYDFNHVITYERLPWQVVEGDPRFYPANQEILKNLIEDQIDYIVIHSRSEEIVQALLDRLTIETNRLSENNPFFIYEVIR
jgi:hypothetical protein